MRLILCFLARTNFRWARASVERAIWLDAKADEAYRDAAARCALAEDQLQRAASLFR